MAADPGTALVVRRMLAGSPEAVFRAWTEPELMSKWMSPVGTAEAMVDLRVGGSFRVVMRGDGREIEHTGEYRAIDPPRLLAFTWVSPYTGPAPSLVTVRLRPHGDGTELELTHEDLPPGGADSHAGGWGRMLDRLTEVTA